MGICVPCRMTIHAEEPEEPKSSSNPRNPHRYIPEGMAIISEEENEREALVSSHPQPSGEKETEPFPGELGRTSWEGQTTTTKNAP